MGGPWGESKVPDQEWRPRAAAAIWKSGPAILERFNFGATNVETSDEAAFKLKDVPDHLIEQQLSLQVADELMDFNDHPVIRAIGKADRLDVRIDGRPLSRPILPDTILLMDIAAFHPIRP